MPHRILLYMIVLSATACALPAPIVAAPTLPAPRIAPSTRTAADHEDDEADTESLAASMELLDGDELSPPTDDPCAAGAAGTALSPGATLACAPPSTGSIFVPPTADVSRLEQELDDASGASRAPILRQLATHAFAWECDAWRSLTRACGQSPPGLAAADAFRRVAVHTRRAANSYCRELRQEHPDFTHQCP